ncbi:hypothetical protein TNCV_2996681 [Trichonephila clavipes]|nr:hypothetical protein TNCV_2996681 [Trichonephila clavipes]
MKQSKILNIQCPPPQWAAIKLTNVDRSAVMQKLGNTGLEGACPEVVGGFDRYLDEGRENIERSMFNPDFLLPFVDDLDVHCTIDFRVEQYFHYYRPPALIIPNLYIGNIFNALDFEFIFSHNITYILNVTPNVKNFFERVPGLTYKRIPVGDRFVAIFDFFEEAADFIGSWKNHNVRKKFYGGNNHSTDYAFKGVNMKMDESSG